MHLERRNWWVDDLDGVAMVQFWLSRYSGRCRSWPMHMYVTGMLVFEFEFTYVPLINLAWHVDVTYDATYSQSENFSPCLIIFRTRKDEAPSPNNMMLHPIYACTFNLWLNSFLLTHNIINHPSYCGGFISQGVAEGYVQLFSWQSFGSSNLSGRPLPRLYNIIWSTNSINPSIRGGLMHQGTAGGSAQNFV